MNEILFPHVLCQLYIVMWQEGFLSPQNWSYCAVATTLPKLMIKVLTVDFFFLLYCILLLCVMAMH